MFHSIFRQRTFEKLYDLYIPRSKSLANCNHHNWCENKQKCFDSLMCKMIHATNNGRIIDDSIVYDSDIDLEFSIGDKIYLDNDLCIASITDKSYLFDGSIVYYLEDRYVETDNTKKSYNECRKRLETWNYSREQYNKLEEEIFKYKYQYENIKNEFDRYKKKYKFKHRFINLKRNDCY